MISFGAKKAVDTGAIERIQGWASAALAGSDVFAADVTLMVAELACLEPGCPPVETVVSVMDKDNPQKIKIIKGMGDVTEEDVTYAMNQLKAEAGAPPITVTVKTPVGTRVEVTTQALETICDLKDKVTAQSGLAKERLRLMFLGRGLSDHDTVAQSGLTAGCEVEHGVGANFFWQGEGTLAIPMALYVKNRSRLLAEFGAGTAKLNMCGHCACPANSHILLQGGEETTRDDTDHGPLFRQESFFHWATGVTEPDCFLALDVDGKKSTLFVPRLPEEYGVWMGAIMTTDEFVMKYSVDECKYTDQLDDHFASFDSTGSTSGDGLGGSEGAHDDNAMVMQMDAPTIYTLHGKNTDSGAYSKAATFKGIEKHRVDNGRLFPIIVELRVVKTPEEMEVMRYVSDVTSKAHMEVMRQCAPGKREYQMEALFMHEVYDKAGCRNCAYTCICATGPNPAILHYGHAGAPNARLICDGDIGLYDMGAEYHCYCSDITSSFPANGTFTEDQAGIYQAVEAAVAAVEAAMKPGCDWVEMHRLAWRVQMTHLLRMGVVQGDIDGMIQARVPELFMACGLGHLIGIDTHDVGGYPRGILRVDEPGLNRLRCARKLKEGMVLTVEPGIYFNGYQIDKGLANPEQAPFLCKERLQGMRHCGGVRIEDVVAVTATGIEQLTTVPRDVARVEAICQGGHFDPLTGKVTGGAKDGTTGPLLSEGPGCQ